jgi:16S rRNA (cytidine1402-2'-O)-methyltransferase
MNPTSPPGKLYVLATPLGHLGDISRRCLETLREVSLVACEDTRVSRKLGTLAESQARFVSHHKFNERQTLPRLIRALQEGQSIALLTDAGTPGISDPGYLLVEAALSQGLTVVPVPGPSAVTTACSVSGFNCASFFFAGFLPRKETALQDLLIHHTATPAPLVFFESPERMPKTLKRLQDLLKPDTRVCLCREMTKKFETLIHGTLAECIDQMQGEVNRGEWTGVIEQVHLQATPPDTDHLSIEEVCSTFKVPRSVGAKILSLVTGKSRKSLYQSKD